MKTNSKPVCNDCKKEIKGKMATYHTKNGDYYKCEKCFMANSTLENYQKCEVYSRVVGYMRPVENWNIGKQEEFKDRKEYKNK